MPLKILIALAMVNKSPVTACRGSQSSVLQQPVALQGHICAVYLYVLVAKLQLQILTLVKHTVEVTGPVAFAESIHGRIQSHGEIC